MAWMAHFNSAVVGSEGSSSYDEASLPWIAAALRTEAKTGKLAQPCCNVEPALSLSRLVRIERPAFAFGERAPT